MLPDQEKCQNFLQFLHHLCLRPAMYLGKANFDLIYAFLGGFSFGVNYGLGKSLIGFPSKQCPMERWNIWIFHKYAIFRLPDWGFKRIVYHHNDHDETKAISALSGLYEEFLKEREHFITTDYDTLKKELEQKVIKKYWNSSIYGHPDCECNGWLEKT